ncbi:MAG TPA: AraC family transcriptional regulator [Longimicrobiales bacterium]|nr:AraC family transcriptional regulator [Longimicrobiales bacterium]
MFSEHELSFFAPPYFEPIRAGQLLQHERPPRGVFLLWDLRHTMDFAVTAEQVTRRPHGMALVIVLPPPHELHRIRDVVDGLVDFHPCAILPASLNSSERLRQLLRNLPRRPHQEFVEYFKRRGLLCDDRSRQEVDRLFAEARVVRSVATLARRMASSRRTLGRHFAGAGLPAPSRWLQFARLLYVSLYLQRNRCSIGRAAAEMGYPDPFTMSNQMKRLTGLRPSEVKSRFGWSWIVECWLVEEARRGGFDRERYRRALGPYLTQPSQAQTRRSFTAAPVWPQPRARPVQM